MSWETLHREQRHQLRWPSEHVVRFLAATPHVGKAVDIGCGAGRHVKLLRDYTGDISCCDTSEAGLTWCRLLTGITGQVASMTDLPYPDDTFDTAVAYGVFYYGSMSDHEKAVAELHRILKPGGRALVSVRSAKDWRTKHMQAGRFVCAGEPEHEMLLTFVREASVYDMDRHFRFADYEYAITTSRERKRVNSDLLITVTK
jgi:SAM-dependent methyltransferase